MNTLEKRAALSLGGVYAMRMLGLFLVLPVFALHSHEFSGATPYLTGLALGIYGLTQACLQIPMGALSDHFGRRRIIVLGLLLFCAGGLVAASAETIYGVIAGRALQGAGAVASALMALAADLSREEQRSKVNAAIGAAIGLSFAAALVLGPLLQALIGLSGIFLLTSALGVVSIVIVTTAVPRAPRRAPVASRIFGAGMRSVLTHPELLRLCWGVFALHAAMASNFVVLPTLIADRTGLADSEHGWFYLALLAVSFLLMLPMLMLGERRGRVKWFFLFSIALAALGQSAWYFAPAPAGFVFCLLLFFIAFNYLEANLPALVSRSCSADSRGAAMGVFSTAQFAGVFFGSTAAGLAAQSLEAAYAAPLVAVVLFVWFLVAFGMSSVKKAPNHVIKGGHAGRD